MEKVILQITSGKGPVECELAVALLLKELLKEVNTLGFKAQELNRSQGFMNGTLASVTLEVSGKGLMHWSNQWQGIIQWICISPYRKMHKRKNWFIAVHVFETKNGMLFNAHEVVFKSMKAGGPGGQHVNKTESAVRAIHGPSGIMVTASESRSQHENKKLALQKLKTKVENWSIQSQLQQASIEWLNHHQLERGNPKRMYEGLKFRKI